MACVVNCASQALTLLDCVARADTLKLMMPLNKQLLLAESNAQPRAWKGAKLALWAKLHHFRTAASCAALGFVVYKFVAKDD